ATTGLNDLNPRILSPASETMIALDPDIPRDLQRVKFEAGPGAEGSHWILDSHDLGPAAALVVWPPPPGVNALALVDRSGRALDRVSFKVRGEAPSDTAR